MLLLNSKKNGEVTSEIISVKDLVKLHRQASLSRTHLCDVACPPSQCNAIDCPKVRDIEKKTIDEYPFITDGFEVRQSDDKLCCMFVNNCELYNNYVKEQPKVKVKKRK